MTTPDEDDQFERIRLVARIERARALIAQYEESQEFYRRQIEDSRYELGRLDKRLGGEAMIDDPHIQALRDALRTEHEEWIAEVQQWADEAAAKGDTVHQRRHLDHVARLKAMPYPWETKSDAA
jgi:hypothetical protein